MRKWEKWKSWTGGKCWQAKREERKEVFRSKTFLRAHLRWEKEIFLCTLKLPHFSFYFLINAFASIIMRKVASSSQLTLLILFRNTCWLDSRYAVDDNPKMQKLWRQPQTHNLERKSYKTQHEQPYTSRNSILNMMLLFFYSFHAFTNLAGTMEFYGPNGTFFIALLDWCFRIQHFLWRQLSINKSVYISLLLLTLTATELAVLMSSRILNLLNSLSTYTHTLTVLGDVSRNSVRLHFFMVRGADFIVDVWHKRENLTDGAAADGSWSEFFWEETIKAKLNNEINQQLEKSTAVTKKMILRCCKNVTSAHLYPNTYAV